MPPRKDDTETVPARSAAAAAKTSAIAPSPTPPAPELPRVADWFPSAGHTGRAFPGELSRAFPGFRIRAFCDCSGMAAPPVSPKTGRLCRQACAGPQAAGRRLYLDDDPVRRTTKPTIRAVRRSPFSRDTVRLRRRVCRRLRLRRTGLSGATMRRAPKPTDGDS
jgi:hypothetical protein